MGIIRPWVFILFAFLPCHWCAGDSANDNVPTLRVTHTWGDLLATQPVAFEGVPANGILTQNNAPGNTPPFRVWIGIDRNHAAPNGAVLIYCLAEGITFGEPDCEEVGPFKVNVQQPGQTTAAEAMQSLQAKRLPDATAKYVLYARPVPVQGPGDYIIELQEPKTPASKSPPQVFARIKVRVSGDGVLPWSPWDENSDDAEPASKPGAASMSVSNPEGGVALPKAPQDGIAFQELPARDQALPVLILDRPDPSVHLKMVDSTLIVTLPEPMSNDYPSDRFLTRWWVNDKPFAPDPNVVQAMERAELGQAGDATEIDFPIDFHPERLGAKKGDKIGVQLLVCPYGWEYSGAQMAQAQQQLPAPLTQFTSTKFSYPTARINFTCPGIKPLKVQAQATPKE